MRIFNEKIDVISEGIALVSWQTNLPATSQVLFDTTARALTQSQIDLGVPPYTYASMTAKKTDLVTNHSVLVTSVNFASIHYFRPVSVSGTNQLAVGIELFAKLDAPSGGQCEQYLKEFIQVGANNNPAEVRKLQLFLNDYEKNNLAITSSYDTPTIAAVDRFQEKYFGDILQPWGHDASTSYVYLTTRKKVNEIYCQGKRQFPLTTQQQAEVAAFRALLENIRNQGGQTPDTSGIGSNQGAGTGGTIAEGNTGGTPAGGGTTTIPSPIIGPEDQIASPEEASRGVFGDIRNAFSSLFGRIRDAVSNIRGE